MQDKKIRLKIITPNKIGFDKIVDFVIIRTSKGDMGILPGHEKYAALLGNGVVRAFVNKEQTDVLTVLGGFVTVADDEVIMLSSMAESPDKIEELMASIEREREQNKDNEKAADLEIHRVEEALRRTLVHMDISADSITKGHEEYLGETE